LLKSSVRAIRVGLVTFIISFIIAYLLQFSLPPWFMVLILCIVIITGVIFDIIGTAVTAADETPFHAMAADKVRGSRQAVLLIRHADKVANVCNDVVGDISGTIGGALIAGIVLVFSHHKMLLAQDIISAAAIALVAALSVGGRAAGKSYAIENANSIVFKVGKLLAVFKFINYNLKKNRRKGKTHTRKGK
jgi:CBS domain containing-hemolysin-like protein